MYEIVIEDTASRPLAAVRRRVRIGDVAMTWRPALDQVWAFLRRHEGLRTDGASWEIYGDPGDDPASLEVRVVYLLV